MILKWYDGKKWQSFFYGAFENIKKDLRDVIHSINNAGNATKERVHRHKNLSDLYNVATARTNLQCVGDMSQLSSATHTHDSFKRKLENEEKRALEQLQRDIDYVKGLTPCSGSV